jgi:hypothetical protein
MALSYRTSGSACTALLSSTELPPQAAFGTGFAAGE